MNLIITINNAQMIIENENLGRSEQRRERNEIALSQQTDTGEFNNDKYSLL